MARVKLEPGGGYQPADDGYEVSRKDFQEVCKSNFVGCKLLGVLTDEQGRRRWVYDIGHCKVRPVLTEDGEWVRKRVHTDVGVNHGGHDSQIQPASWHSLDKLEIDHPGVGQIKKPRRRVELQSPSAVPNGKHSGKKGGRVKLRTRVRVVQS